MASINPGRGKGESASSPRRIQAKERQRQALELRKAGATYEDIASKLRYASATGAHKAVVRAMQAIIEEPAQEVRKIEIERLDRMLLSVWGQVRDGNLGAIDRVLRIMERRARLLGLDAPTVAQHRMADADGEVIPGLSMPVFVERPT